MRTNRLNFLEGTVLTPGNYSPSLMASEIVIKHLLCAIFFGGGVDSYSWKIHHSGDCSLFPRFLKFGRSAGVSKVITDQGPREMVSG